MTLTCPLKTGNYCAGQNSGLPPNERFDGTHQISITQLAQLANTGLKQSPPTHNEF